MAKKTIISAFILFLALSGYSQTISAPNAALKSHETLDIVRIVLSPEKTEVYLSIENRISGGSFCADRNISLVYPDGTKIRLISSNGIPVCPAAYTFKNIGERLDFVLVFPPLKKGTGYVNLIEECSDYCFSFYGIVLNDELNRKLDEAFGLAEKGEPAMAVVSLTRLAGDTGATNQAATGVLYLNLVKMTWSAGSAAKAREWYKKLEASGLPETKLYLAHLDSLGIRF